jgi:hypothetical protein
MGQGTVVAFVVAASVRLGCSSTVMFTATEHFSSPSGTAAVASEIGGAAIASASSFDSFAVA